MVVIFGLGPWFAILVSKIEGRARPKTEEDNIVVAQGSFSKCRNVWYNGLYLSYTRPYSKEPQLKCLDLHRFIRFIPKSYTCTNPLEAADIYPSPPTRSDPHHEVIPKAVIFQRRMHLLHLAHLDRAAAQAARKLEMAQFLKKRREYEERMRIPFSERTFIYDPSGIDLPYNFFQKVDVDKLRGREKACAICRKLASEERSRRLPCGCVLDLECVVGWMRDRKDCAVCGRVFRLVKAGSLDGEVGCGCPSWEDDGGAEFF
ncbi:hypothetical protein BDZ45DRAFT_723390 [Acephala macrosclerotiorum]|nr:hypothetical protein BDZ45DRAFT_723390 [Acephala macrosclerotiorum]